jgi:hypothetical protein
MPGPPAGPGEHASPMKRYLIIGALLVSAITSQAQNATPSVIGRKPKEIVAWVEAFDRQINGAVLNRRLRRELQGQPKIEGLCGPMYDGINADGAPVIRYEDQATYDLLSA